MPAATKAHPKKKAKPNRWSASVNTDSTHPPEGLFTKSAATIARSLASRNVSPKGPASGVRMLAFYINRAGRNLSASRRAELEKAKDLLSKRLAREEQKKKKV
jgi:Protein of unknown function (DUF3175)